MQVINKECEFDNMSLYFHKRKKIGAFNFNFSKNGIGTSMKLFKGCNIGVDARGRTYISGGLFGFRYREYLDNNSKEDLQEQINPKKFFIAQIPNKYKSTFWHKMALFLFWFFAIPFIVCIWGLFMPEVENLKVSEYLIYGCFLLFSAYRLFFSNRAKQRRLMNKVIYYAINDDAQNAITNIDNIMSMENNPVNNEKLFKIKNALIIAINKEHPAQYYKCQSP